MKLQTELMFDIIYGTNNRFIFLIKPDSVRVIVLKKTDNYIYFGTIQIVKTAIINRLHLTAENYKSNKITDYLTIEDN